MKRHTPRKRRQGGFTLVEMSVTMAAAGLLFAAVTTGQELIDQAKAAKLVNDVKALEANIQRFAQAKSRLPGDCNSDGLIDYEADGASAVQDSDLFADGEQPIPAHGIRTDAGNALRAAQYSYSVLLPTIPDDGAVADDQQESCAAWGSATASSTVVPSTTNANVWINDLKTAGVISDSVPNRKYAKLVHEDFVFVGTVNDGAAAYTTASASSANYNAIVIHNVPQWMARRLSTAINGQDARSDRSRVRQLTRTTEAGVYASAWQTVENDALGGNANPNMRDAMVTVAYFFDRVPESKKQ